MHVFRQLDFLGIRIVAVLQGIDTQDDQSEVLMTDTDCLMLFSSKNFRRKRIAVSKDGLSRDSTLGADALGTRIR